MTDPLQRHLLGESSAGGSTSETVHRWQRLLFLAFVGGAGLLVHSRWPSPGGAETDSAAGAVDSDFLAATRSAESTRGGVMVKLPERKGLTVDDTTWDTCPGSIPMTWPATSGGVGDKVVNVRLFDPFHNGKHPTFGEYPDDMHALKRFLVHNSAKALLGTMISCNQSADDEHWKRTVEVLGILGPEHVSAIALGNELDLYHYHDIHGWCPKQPGGLWGYLKKNMEQRLHELEHVHGGVFANVSIGTILAGTVLDCGDPQCSPGNMTLIPGFKDVLKWLVTVVPIERLILGINFYPYFQPCPPLDGKDEEAMTCERWTHLATCTDDVLCVTRQTLLAGRYALKEAIGDRGLNTRLWIGEFGWSAARAGTLNTDACNQYSNKKAGQPRAICPGWSSQDNYANTYKGFLEWDLSIAPGVAGVEHAFWFTIRDSVNYGEGEYFGVCGFGATCNNNTDKVIGGTCDVFSP